MNRVVHFEIPTHNVEVARKFYSDVFGWNIYKWEGTEDYWLITTGEASTPGIDGGFMQTQDELKGYINTVDVANLDETLTKVLANGGEVVLPKGPVPGVGWLAYAKDPEGTIFGIMQADTKVGM